MSDNRKTLILDALRAFVARRPGFDLGNYDRAGYRSDSRRVTQQRHDFDRMAQSVETLDEITADDLIAAFHRAFSGRLTLTAPNTMHPGGARSNTWQLDYCAGQYWCTEYRAAACAVLASALWTRAHKDISESRANDAPNVLYRHESPGDQLRATFRKWYGPGIQKRWFN